MGIKKSSRIQGSACCRVSVVLPISMRFEQNPRRANCHNEWTVNQSKPKNPRRFFKININDECFNEHTDNIGTLAVCCVNFVV